MSVVNPPIFLLIIFPFIVLTFVNAYLDHRYSAILLRATRLTAFNQDSCAICNSRISTRMKYNRSCEDPFDTRYFPAEPLIYFVVLLGPWHVVCESCNFVFVKTGSWGIGPRRMPFNGSMFFPCLGLAGSVHSGPFASPGWAACYTTDFVELNDRSCLWH